MWRNDKASVGDELLLPPRTLEVWPLTVSLEQEQELCCAHPFR
jgi:hypothetical protein